MDDFPYKKYFTKPPRILLDNVFKYLNDETFVRWYLFDDTDENFHRSSPGKKYINTFDYKFMDQNLCLMIGGDELYYNVDIIPDLYIEDIRIKSRVHDSISPSNYWKKYKEFIMAESARDPRPMKHMEKMRDYIYLNCKECNLFRISVAYSIIKRFSKPGDTMLDPCSGWGDRAISASLAGVKYTGIDPNEDLFNGYEQMKKDLDIIPKFLNIPFEKYSSRERFDLVFTSPPFSSFEVYVENARHYINQSIFGKNHQKWLDDWFAPFLANCVRYLKKNGHLILYVSDTRDRPIIDFMFNEMKKQISVQFLGTIAIKSNRGFPLPLFIWKKIDDRKLYNLEF